MPFKGHFHLAPGEPTLIHERGLAPVSPEGYLSNICSNIHSLAKGSTEMSVPQPVTQITKALDVTSEGATPIEFTFKGRRFRIHAILSRWCEAGGWWNHVSDGKYRPDDQARSLWRVEAAPIGALTTFELERDEVSGQWIIRNL